MRGTTLVAAAALAGWTVPLCGQTPPGFGTFSPDRGFLPYGSYAISDIESIDQANGGLTLRIPLAKLPPGRGGFHHGVDLVYTSQIYDLNTEFSSPSFNLQCTTGCPPVVNALISREGHGGWSYSYNYRFEVETRPGISSICVLQAGGGYVPETYYGNRYSIVLPDGSAHVLRLAGSADNSGDGYYPHYLGGQVQCSGAVGDLTTPLHFYTTDGTFIQVTASPTSWTATFPDGRTVYGRTGLYFNQADRICDRNTNCVGISNQLSDNIPYTEIIDDLGRSIRIRYNTNGPCTTRDCYSETEDIFQAGYGGDGVDPTGVNSYAWHVEWGSSQVGDLPYFCNSPSEGQQIQRDCKLPSLFSVRHVQSIRLPVNSALEYSFFYSDGLIGTPAAKRGWGELIEMRLPNAQAVASDYRPRVEYSYLWNGGYYRGALTDSENRIQAKSLYRNDSLLALATPEVWTYTYPEGGNDPSGTITGPDGGTTRSYFIPDNGLGKKKLVWRTVTPDGGETLRRWEYNTPHLGSAASLDRKNAYVRAEYRRPGNISTYAATQYDYDGNGNLKIQTDYNFHSPSWGTSTPAYSGVTLPNGPKLRRINHSYFVQQADATDTSTPALGVAGAYWNWSGSNPPYRGAIMRTVVDQGAGTSAEGATEFSYDNPTTTANVVTEAKWDNSLGAPLPAAVGTLGRGQKNASVTDYTWSQGNLVRMVAPNHERSVSLDVTTFTYNQCGSNLYLDRIVRHQGQGAAFEETTDYQSDCATGLLKQITREPGQGTRTLVSKGEYDLYGRIKSQIEASGSAGATELRKTLTGYEDVSRVVGIQSSLDSANDLRISKFYDFDDLGQLELEKGTDDNGGSLVTVTNGTLMFTPAVGVRVDRGMRYVCDGSNCSGALSGRYELTSSPNRYTDPVDAPRSWERRRYDKGGRLVELKVFKSSMPFPWDGTANESASNPNIVATTTYSYPAETTSGVTTKITDAAGRQRQEVRDGLGRIKSATDGLGLVSATYEYNAAGQIRNVTQGTQIREFKYDSLGRLFEASNPESGKTYYRYYGDGLLWARADGRTAGGALVSVTLNYDAAQRLTTKVYSDGTPTVVYCYDGRSYSGGLCTSSVSRASDGSDYPRGRLTGVGNANAWTNHRRVDALGRTLEVEQGLTGMGTRTVQYTYAANGAVKSVTYPTGRVVNYSLTDAGRVLSVIGSAAYVNQAVYSASGLPLNALLANATVQEKRSYNWLGQMTEMRVGAGGSPNYPVQLGKLTFDYGVTGINGNLLGQTIDAGGAGTFYQYYGYDQANRLRMAMEGTNTSIRNGQDLNLNTTTCNSVAGNWCTQFGYDGFGNVRQESDSRGAYGLKATNSSWYVAAKNQVTGALYDLAGNPLQVPLYNAPIAQYAADWDAESRLVRIRNTNPATVIGEYAYDADGRRVKRVAGGVTTFYVYGLDGQVLTEYQFGGAGSNGTEYVLSDHLGSTRLKLNGSGQVVARHDYEPFGSEITLGRSGEYGWADALTRRFTGKERDAETGLDYFGARYYSGAQGRMTSPDPFMIVMAAEDREQLDRYLSNPQNWNRYAYAFNNPLRFIDPTGLDPISVSDCQKDSECTVVKLNVIFDKNADIYDKKGNLRQEYQSKLNAQLAQVTDEYGNAKIAFDVKFSSAAVGKDLVGEKGALNVVVTDSRESLGSYSWVGPSGASYTRLNIGTSLTNPYRSTLAHELAHQFTGDTRSWGIPWLSNAIADENNDLGRAILRNWNTTGGRVLRAFDPFLYLHRGDVMQNARRWYGGR